MKTFYLSFEVFYEDAYSETDTKIVNSPNMNLAKLLLEKSLREDGYESIRYFDDECYETSNDVRV